MEKIGILLPRSTYYETIWFDMSEGLRAGIEKCGGKDVDIVTENVGFGAEKEQVYRAAERLLFHEKVNIVFAYIGHRTAQLLRPLFMASKSLLIVLDAGTNLPQEWPVCPNILYHSLHNSLGIWLAANLAMRDGFKQTGVSSCFYDGGYLHIVAAYQSWQSKGGQIVYNHSPGNLQESFTMAPLIQYSNTFPEACLIPVFSGETATRFYEEVKVNFPKKIPAMYLVPFNLEEDMLAKTPFPGNGAKGVASWSKELDNPQNKLFVETMGKLGVSPNLFSLLGWEAAELAMQSLKLIKDEPKNILQVGEKLKDFEFEGPRGIIHFNKEYNYTLSPMFEVALCRNEKGNCKIEVVSNIKTTEAEFLKLAAEDLNGALSGWFNAYTCI